MAVAIGAFGAHGLKEIIGPDRLPIFETGSKYHFYHTIVSLLILILANQNGMNRYLKISYILFMIGILLFSFSLYALAITGIKILGIITPLGGVCFLLGWILLGIGTLQSREEP
jgi:uncharacterized membrane protein YgdD (TMEM256/DUF423 family)